MKSKVLKKSWVVTCCALALAGCNNDDGGDDAGTAGTGSGGTTNSGTGGGASGESGGTPGGGSGGTLDGGSGGSAGAGGTSTFDADCANLCELEATCAARGAGGEAGASSPPSSTDECLMSCAIIRETLPDEPCRAELEAYFACIGRIEPDTAVCIDGVPNWEQYCVAELAANEDCP
jgi:hypothetical protein